MGEGFARELEKCGGEPLVVLRDGRPVAIVLTVREEVDLARSDEARVSLADVVENGWNAYERGDWQSHDAFWAALDAQD